MRLLLKSLPTALLVGAVLLLAACGGDDTSGSSSADVQRFCEVTAQLDKEGTRIFNQVQSNRESHKVLLQKQRAFLKQEGDLLDEAQATAPDEISDAVATEIAASRASAGEGPAVDAQKLSDAQTQVDAYRKKNCKPSPS